MLLRRRGVEYLTTVPLSFVEPHESQAKHNHGGQSLQRLAERGGLSPAELVAVVEDRKWSNMADDEALRLIKILVKEHLDKRGR